LIFTSFVSPSEKLRKRSQGIENQKVSLTYKFLMQFSGSLNKNEEFILNKSVDQNYRITSQCVEEENIPSSSFMWAGRSDFPDLFAISLEG